MRSSAAAGAARPARRRRKQPGVGCERASRQVVALVFAPGTDGVFDVHVDAAVPAPDAQAAVAAVDRSYGAQVQQATYRRVIEQGADQASRWSPSTWTTTTASCSPCSSGRSEDD